MFVGNDGVLETGRWYFKHFGTGARREAPNADDLRDRSLIERVDSKREITIDAVEAFYQAIVAGKPVNMTKDATESTLSCLLGRMAYETKREVTWEELMASESSVS
ncbi:MAG TPA: hypothetical protein VKE70_11900 [Candidatus Solibacter sp.]|nr:hypothetical protein [Candidatus Solibacter sp.]